MKIVVLDGYTLNPGDNPWTELESLGELTVHDRTPSDAIIARCRDAEIVLTNKTPLNAETIAALPNLKLISVMATGYNVVDVGAAAEHRVVVCNVPAYSTDSVAQHVFALLLSWLHRPRQHHDAVQAGRWMQKQDFSFWLQPLVELKGKTLGIVGLGRIGRATAQVAAAFGMKVIAASRTQTEPMELPGFRWAEVEEVFAEADVVSLHCPLTADNQHFVQAKLLATMRPTAILINTARGGLINEHDLADALRDGQLAAALLDVTSTEPIENTNPLLSAPNCLITPHIAWATVEARRRAMQITAENIQRFAEGQPVNVVSE